jgi:uncharacterized protein (DUF111 family)
MHETPAQVVELVANVDDVTGEQAAAAIESLLEAGALDAWATPIVMKKGRPAMMISVLASQAGRPKLTQLLIAATGTFGVRHRLWDRTILDRRHETVMTEFGDVRIKVGSLHGRDVAAKCEFDDAAKAAAEHGVPVRQVTDAALAAYHGRRPA